MLIQKKRKDRFVLLNIQALERQIKELEEELAKLQK